MGARAGEKVTDKGKGASLQSELDAEHLQPHRSTACRTDDQKQPMDLELNNDQDDASLESCSASSSSLSTEVDSYGESESDDAGAFISVFSHAHDNMRMQR